MFLIEINENTDNNNNRTVAIYELQNYLPDDWFRDQYSIFYVIDVIYDEIHM